eukprot:4858231-Prymnesium_polylepis.1
MHGSPSSSSLPLMPITLIDSGISRLERKYGSKPDSPFHCCVSTVAGCANWGLAARISIVKGSSSQGVS